MSKNGVSILRTDSVSSKIYLIRGKRLMLDSDLAQLYGVSTKNLNKAVRRNLSRFPNDFMFRLDAKEAESLRFQIGTSNKRRGGRRYLPYAFTREGVAMLSGVLNSSRAIRANIQIMRTFTKISEMLASNELIRKKIEELERKYEKHDHQFKIIFDAIRELLAKPEPVKKNLLGFT